MTKFSSKRPLTDAEEAEIQKMIKSDPDAPEITDAQARNPMSFSEAMKRGPDRPRLHNAKKAVTLRLDSEIVQRFKAKGDDWRIRMAKVRKDAS